MSMRAKKQLGQNFLMHPATAERIVAAAKLPEASCVLEIGPGTGLLTEALLGAGHKVTAVEADPDLVPGLTERFSESPNFRLIEGDIRATQLTRMGAEYHVVANIPYYITGEIIRLLTEAQPAPASITLLVQKEVAERVVRSKKESILSLAVKAYGVPSIAFSVPRGAFRPAPKVDSAVLHVRKGEAVFDTKAAETRFFALLHAGFAHKRKLLTNNLEAVAPKDTIDRVFAELGIPPRARAEDLGLFAWIALSKRL